MSAAREPLRAAPPRIDPLAALRGFFLIMDAWHATAEEARIILGAPAERTYYAWRAGNAVRVPADTLRRIFDDAEASGATPLTAAMEVARRRLVHASG